MKRQPSGADLIGSSGGLTLDPVDLGSRRPDAASLLRLWAALTLILPAKLVLAPLGSAGSPAQVLGMAGAFWWMASHFLSRLESGRRPRAVQAAMGVFWFACLISYFVAVTRPIEAIELSAADRGMLVVLAWAGVLMVAGDGITTRGRLDDVLRVVVAGTAVGALVGLLQFTTGTAFVDRISIPGLTHNSAVTGVFARNGFSRAAGTSTHPIEFGVLLTMVLPLALHLALNDTRRGRLRRWFPVAAIGAAIPVTLSRSAILGLALVLLVVLPTWPKDRRRWAYLWLVGGFGAVYVSVPGMLGTMARLFTGIASDNSALSRVDSYDIALHYVSLDPLFGRGFGTFLPRYHILDNQYLGTLVETGIVGLLAFLALLATAAVVAARMARRLPSATDRSLAVSLVAGLASAAAAAGTFDALGFPQVAGMLFLFLGLVAALSRLTATASPLRTPLSQDVANGADRLGPGDLARRRGAVRT